MKGYIDQFGLFRPYSDLGTCAHCGSTAPKASKVCKNGEYSKTHCERCIALGYADLDTIEGRNWQRLRNLYGKKHYFDHCAFCGSFVRTSWANIGKRVYCVPCMKSGRDILNAEKNRTNGWDGDLHGITVYTVDQLEGVALGELDPSTIVRKPRPVDLKRKARDGEVCIQ